MPKALVVTVLGPQNDHNTNAAKSLQSFAKQLEISGVKVSEIKTRSKWREIDCDYQLEFINLKSVNSMEVFSLYISYKCICCIKGHCFGVIVPKKRGLGLDRLSFVFCQSKKDCLTWYFQSLSKGSFTRNKFLYALGKIFESCQHGVAQSSS